MATWQVSVRLIPRSAVEHRFGGTPRTLSADQYEQGEWWTADPDSQTLVAAFDELLPRGASWTPRLHMWGAEDANRIDLWLEDGQVLELTARIDARTPDEFIDMIANVCARYGLVVINQEHSVLQPTAQQLRLEIARSPAARFVADPEEFLKNIEGDPPLRLE